MPPPETSRNGSSPIPGGFLRTSLPGPTPSTNQTLETRERTLATWSDSEWLFRKYHGVQAGCWCMFYHREGPTDPSRARLGRTRTASAITRCSAGATPRGSLPNETVSRWDGVRSVGARTCPARTRTEVTGDGPGTGPPLRPGVSPASSGTARIGGPAWLGPRCAPRWSRSAEGEGTSWRPMLPPMGGRSPPGLARRACSNAKGSRSCDPSVRATCRSAKRSGSAVPTRQVEGRLPVPASREQPHNRGGDNAA